MKSKKKKIILVIVIIFAVIIFVGGGIVGGIIVTNKMVNQRYNYLHNIEIEDFDLSQATDGAYTGEYSYGKNTYYAYVEIQSNQIKSIEIEVDTKESNQKYVEKAKAIIDSIILKQSLEIEAVTGATRSSNSIRLAVDDAINRAILEN